MCANWAGDNRDRPMSPDRNDHYQLDNVGLQIGLGLPLQLLGVSLMNNSLNRIPRQNGNRGRGRGRGGYRRNHYQQNQNRKLEIQKTLDGIPIRKLYITNISIETRHQELRDIFCRFGHIHLIYMGVSKNDSYKQFAFITFVDPMAAARVLSQERFQDMRGRTLFAMAADSWHQPRERPDGTIDWEPGRKTVPRHEEEGEEDEEQSTEEAPSQIETEINEGSLNMLDDDCLLYIFSFLSLKEVTGVERVCKRWQALSFRMWRCLHELNFQKDGPFRKMPCNTKVLDQYLKRCGPSLTSLDLRTSGAAFKDNTLVVVAKHCENLEALKVSNIPVARRSLAHLGRSCPRLKKITMEGCTKVSDYDLNCLLPKCADLRELELSSISDLTGKCLANVKSPVTSLQLSCLLKMEPQYLIKGLKQLSGTLERVSLNACTHLPRMKEVVSEIVAAVPNLSSFSLTQCTMNLDPRSLVPLGQLKKLTSLDLHLNNSVNDTALSAIVEGCEELTSLNLSGSGGGCAGMLSERGLSMLARLRKLTHLNISYLEATNNAALKNFTARNCKLKSLVCRGCPELTDEGTETVVTLSNELELFDLSGCKGVSVKTAETALTSIKMRTNNTPLRIIVGGTMISCSSEVESDSPLLTVDLCDHCEDHLRPDFIDDMFFPPSDDDSDDDFDHLCERIGCDCDFDFDDLFDPTLVNDETRRFGIDYNDGWMSDIDQMEDEEWGWGSPSD